MSDYISRDAILKVLTTSDYPESYVKGIHAAVYEVIDVPAADVQPVVHGRWLETYQPFGWTELACATCSECGEDFVLDEWAIDDLRTSMKYCPNCGAKMDLEAEE